jgi:hypothetical protein
VIAHDEDGGNYKGKVEAKRREVLKEKRLKKIAASWLAIAVSSASFHRVSLDKS